MLVKSNQCFQKNVKTCLQNRKSYLMPPSRHSHFYPILILAVDMVELPQQHANTTVHWLLALPLPIVAKSSILNMVELLDPFLKTWPCTKTSCFFYYYFKIMPPLLKVISFFSVTFYSMMKYF